MLPPYLRWWWAGLIPLSALAAVAEALGAAVVFGFIAVVADQEEAAELPVVGVLTPWLSSGNDRTLIVALGVGLIVFYLLRSLLLAGVAYVHEGLVQRSIVAVADDLFWSYLNAPYTFHLARNSATLIQQMRASIDSSYKAVLSGAARIATEGLIVIALIAMLVFISPLITLAAVALMLLLFLLPNPVTRRFFLRSGEQSRRLDQEVLIGIQQSLGGLKEVRLAGRERFFHSWVIGRRAELGRVVHHRAAAVAALRLMIETAFVTTMLIVVMVVILRLGPGTEVVAILGLFAYATFRLVPSVNRISMSLNRLRAGHAYVTALYRDIPGGKHQPNRAQVDPVTVLPFDKEIVVNQVSYAYEGRDTDAVRELSFSVARCESIGIVGRTGSGKSTLVNLLLGLLEPRTGQIRVDGADIQQSLRGWQMQIGYVPQDFFLVDDSLRRNIAFGLHDADIDDERVAQVVQLARLDEFVGTLSHGVETTAGERGVQLSGGQRQRVAIARALYRNPEVLVFDEAMSALDMQTEEEIVRAIDALHGTKTMFVIAHRLSTVRHCDRILVLEDGQLTAIGSYAELLHTHPLFKQMANQAGTLT